MDSSVVWFILIALLGVLGGWCGIVLGRGPAWQGRLAITIGVLCLITWAFLARHPSVAVQLIPLSLLSRIEGTGAMPLFMLVVGVAWSRGQVTRQKRLAAWSAMLGLVYFVQGGMWMLQTTPATGFANQIEPVPVRQSQEYSCVAAASATALNILHIYTTEAEMAELTETRPGVGATTIRAMNGLSRRLESTPYRVALIDIDYDKLDGLPMPALTPLQFEPGKRHMVTILDADYRRVVLHDPIQGRLVMPLSTFKAHYRGQVIVFLPR